MSDLTKDAKSVVWEIRHAETEQNQRIALGCLKLFLLESFSVVADSEAMEATYKAIREAESEKDALLELTSVQFLEQAKIEPDPDNPTEEHFLNMMRVENILKKDCLDMILSEVDLLTHPEKCQFEYTPELLRERIEEYLDLHGDNLRQLYQEGRVDCLEDMEAEERGEEPKPHPVYEVTDEVPKEDEEQEDEEDDEGEEWKRGTEYDED